MPSLFFPQKLPRCWHGSAEVVEKGGSGTFITISGPQLRGGCCLPHISVSAVSWRKLGALPGNGCAHCPGILGSSHNLC